LSVYFFKAKQFKFSIKLSEIYWPIFVYSALAFACNVVQMLCYRIDIWFLQAYHTNSIVAVYAIAVACLQMFWILSNQIVSVLFTTFAKQQHALAPATIAQIHNILFWLSLITFGIALAFGYYLIPIFFGVAYSQSASLLGVLLIGGIPFSSTLVITAYNASSNKMRINLTGSILGLVVCVLLNFFLIPKYSY
jgi:O-antigen/teichoic acid export membrane protein